MVVGDQSSGKSSVLEGLIRLAFLKDGALYTRFAMQIIFRRTASDKRTISASIIPVNDATDAEDLRKWKASNMESLGNAKFDALMTEASLHGFPMNISESVLIFNIIR